MVANAAKGKGDGLLKQTAKYWAFTTGFHILRRFYPLMSDTLKAECTPQLVKLLHTSFSDLLSSKKLLKEIKVAVMLFQREADFEHVGGTSAASNDGAAAVHYPQIVLLASWSR